LGYSFGLEYLVQLNERRKILPARGADFQFSPLPSLNRGRFEADLWPDDHDPRKSKLRPSLRSWANVDPYSRRKPLPDSKWFKTRTLAQATAGWLITLFWLLPLACPATAGALMSGKKEHPLSQSLAAGSVWAHFPPPCCSTFSLAAWAKIPTSN
jgi:hypothetical protein